MDPHRLLSSMDCRAGEVCEIRMLSGAEQRAEAERLARLSARPALNLEERAAIQQRRSASAEQRRARAEQERQKQEANNELQAAFQRRKVAAADRQLLQPMPNLSNVLPMCHTPSKVVSLSHGSSKKLDSRNDHVTRNKCPSGLRENINTQTHTESCIDPAKHIGDVRTCVDVVARTEEAQQYADGAAQRERVRDSTNDHAQAGAVFQRRKVPAAERTPLQNISNVLPLRLTSSSKLVPSNEKRATNKCAGVLQENEIPQMCAQSRVELIMNSRNAETCVDEATRIAEAQQCVRHLKKTEGDRDCIEDVAQMREQVLQPYPLGNRRPHQDRDSSSTTSASSEQAVGYAQRALQSECAKLGHRQLEIQGLLTGFNTALHNSIAPARVKAELQHLSCDVSLWLEKIDMLRKEIRSIP